MGAKKKTKRKVAKKAAAMVGRRFTPAVIDALLQHVADGGSVRSFCMERKLSRTQAYAHLAEGDRPEQFARARALHAQAIEDEILHIADNPSAVEVTDKKGKKVTVVHPDDVQHRKLQIYAREKRLAWNDPERYGSKQQIQQTTTHKVELTEAERMVRIQQLLDKAAGGKGPQVQVEVSEKEGK